MRGSAAIGALAALALVAPASALAMPRYASPSGGGDCSTPALACNVVTAVNAADTGDEVILAPGIYGSPTRITTALFVNKANVRIHGTAGQPRPRLLFSVSDARAVELDGPGDRMSRVELDNLSGDGIFMVPGASADGIVSSISASGSACTVQGTLVDSVCRAAGPPPAGVAVAVGGVTTFTAVLRNVTGYAVGASSLGLRVSGSTPGHVTANATNSIFRGATGVQTATDSMPATQVRLNIDHSNFTSAVNDPQGLVHRGAGNQTAAPAFVNAGAGNFHLLSTSPTINAGVDAAANGPVDFDGDPRRIGNRTDIGADEALLALTTVRTDRASKVGSRKATLNGTLLPFRATAGYRFQYGRTTAYGKLTPPSLTQSVAATITGLTPSTTYHFRLIATNGLTLSRGADRRFTTRFGGVAIVTDEATVRKRRARIKVRCPARASKRCKGTLTLSEGKHRLGKRKFTIAAGHSRRVGVRISHRGLNDLPLTARATARSKDATGFAARTRATVDLKRP